MTAHQPWCDVTEHEYAVQHHGIYPESCSSTDVDAIPGWEHGAATGAWITTDDSGQPRVFTDLPGAGPYFTVREARAVARLLTEGTPEQLRAWGSALLDLAGRIEPEPSLVR